VLRFGSVCSGIEAASVAWHPLGCRPQFFSEIEKQPRAVLAHRFPDVPLHGDFTTIKKGDYDAIELLVGGTPCQDFSVAGLRKGLTGERGNLTLEFLLLAKRLRPQWVVWENVPGILSSDDGRAFGIFLGTLGQLGYGFAYRVLDAQFYGLAQRRERVFVVGYLGDWRPPAAVLFDAESLRGDSPPRREAGQGVTGTLSARTEGGGGLGTDFEAAGGVIAHALRAEGFDASEDGTGRGTPLVPAISPALKARDYKGPSSDGDGDGVPLIPVAMNLRGREGGAMPELSDVASLRAASGGSSRSYVAFDCKGSEVAQGQDGIAPTLRAQSHDKAHANGGGQLAVAHSIRTANPSSNGWGVQEDVTHTLDQTGGPAIQNAAAVRRLTPRECERLMGFPDDFTLVPFGNKSMADGPRYRMLGNSMAVPVMRKLGERIDLVCRLMGEA